MSGLHTFRMRFLRMVEVWATALPSNLKVSTAFIFTSSGVNLPEFTPSIRSNSGLAASRVHVEMWDKSFSIALASVFFGKRDSDEVNISSTFGVLVNVVAGIGYLPRISLRSVAESGAVMAMFRMDSVSSDSFEVGEHSGSSWSSQPKSASGGMSRTVSVLKYYSDGGLGRAPAVRDSALGRLLGRGEGVSQQNWTTLNWFLGVHIC